MASVCAFCKRGEQASECGRLHVSDNEHIAAHIKCMVRTRTRLVYEQAGLNLSASPFIRIYHYVFAVMHQCLCT